jgi:hypothetical protein
MSKKPYSNDSRASLSEVNWDEQDETWKINGYQMKHYDKCKVISNIYENPEPLAGGRKYGDRLRNSIFLRTII